MKNWYIESAEDTLSAFSSDAETGLDYTQAQKALEAYGKNKIKVKERKGFSEHFLSYLKNILTVVLIISAFIFLVTEIVEAHGKAVNFAGPLLIIAIVILSALFNAFLQTKSEAYPDALAKMNAPLSKVRRHGEICTIPSEDIVPGDIVLLQCGNIVPADGRLIRCSALSCDESILSGKSTPVNKNADAHIDVTCPISDRVNMVYSGGIVLGGEGEYVVTATGKHTEIGSIAGMLANNDDEPAPLQKQLTALGKVFGTAAIILCGVLFIVGGLITKDWLRIFITAASLAVSAVPWALTAIVAVALSLGAQRMLKKGAVIRKLHAAEALSRASVICSDTCGVLTLNEMALARAWSCEDNALRNIKDLSPGDNKSIVKLIQLAALCSCDAWEHKAGVNTDNAVISALSMLGQEKHQLESAFSPVFKLPFDSDREMMTAVFSAASGIISITKGTPENILPLCSGADRVSAEAVCESMRKDGLRVLAVACRKFSSVPEKDSKKLEKSLTLIGIIGIASYPKEEIRSSIRTCNEAGIRTVMITDDHVVTASALAEDMGILSAGDEVIGGDELEKMSDSELCTCIRKYSVYSKITPYDRARIVRAWQNAGETVVITGSKVTDTPSLIEANVGYAMGISGTDAAKDAADIILTDDSFSSVVSTAHEGRGIFRNIAKSVQHLLSCSIGEITAILFCLLLFGTLPFDALHILFINFLIAYIPALALCVEPVGSELMQNRHRAASGEMMGKSSAIQACLHGLMLGILSVIAFAAGLSLGSKDIAAASSMAFGTLALSQLVHIMTVRVSGTIFSKDFVSNKIMLYTQAGSVSVILSLMLIPPFMKVFSFAPLSGTMWLWVILLAVVPALVSEIVKPIIKFYNGYSV